MAFFRNGINPVRIALPGSSLIVRWTLIPNRCHDLNCTYDSSTEEVKEVENALMFFSASLTGCKLLERQVGFRHLHPIGKI